MVNIGRIVGVFGLIGQIKVQPTTDFPERFEPGSSVFIAGKRYRVDRTHWHKAQVRLKLRGISSVNAAEEFVGKWVQVPLTDRPQLEKNEFYANDLIGLTVQDPSGKVLGKIDEIFPAAQDILVIGEILVPMVSEFVKNVDLTAGVVTVQLLPGMEPEAE